MVRGPTRRRGSAALRTPVRFVARVGASDLAYHRAALEKFGVEACLARDEDHATGTIVVLVGPDGERSMFTDRGANTSVREADLPVQLLENVALLHVSGYQFFESTTRSVIRDLWTRASEAGIATSVDPASVAGLEQVGAEPFLEWTSGARFIFPNLDEACFLTGRSEPDAIVAELLRHYSVVALKLGRAGALVASTEGETVQVDAQPAAVPRLDRRGGRLLCRIPRLLDEGSGPQKLRPRCGQDGRQGGQPGWRTATKSVNGSGIIVS